MAADDFKDFNGPDSVDIRLKRYDQEWRIKDKTKEGRPYVSVTSPTVPQSERVNTEFHEDLEVSNEERESLLKNPRKDQVQELVDRAMREWQIRQKDERSQEGI